MQVRKTEWHKQQMLNVGKGATARVNIDKEGASGWKIICLSLLIRIQWSGKVQCVKLQVSQAHQIIDDEQQCNSNFTYGYSKCTYIILTAAHTF